MLKIYFLQITFHTLIEIVLALKCLIKMLFKLKHFNETKIVVGGLVLRK